MVAIADTMDGNELELSIEGHARSGALSWLLGATLCLAAAGLWLVPGASFDPVLVLMKLGITVFFVLGGITFLLAARRAQHPEVVLDGRRGVLHLVERDERGHLVRDVAVDYDDLSEIDFRDGMLIARDHHGRTVVEMPVEQSGDMNDIRAALGPAFARTA